MSSYLKELTLSDKPSSMSLCTGVVGIFYFIHRKARLRYKNPH